MSIITDFLGQALITDLTTANYEILDNIYSSNAIWLQNAIPLNNIPFVNQYISDIPLPLIGFQYRVLGEVVMSEYQWSEYPFLSKQIITNAGIKQATRFQVEVFSVLSENNTVALNQLKVSTIVKLLDDYIARGGLFTVLTLWGTISDCTMERISGIADGEMVDGTHLRFYFKKPNIDQTAKVTAQFTNAMNVLQSGGAIDLGSLGL